MIMMMMMMMMMMTMVSDLSFKPESRVTYIADHNVVVFATCCCNSF